MPSYVPSGRQIAILAAVGVSSLGYASYLRYAVVENVPIGLVCDTGEPSMTCVARSIAIAFDQNGVFGFVAAGAGLLTLIRPQLATFAIGLGATGFGLVLHNAGLAGLAAGLLVLSLARPAPPPEWPPIPPAPGQTTAPANSKSSH
jgi:hypothetical protein